MKPRSAPAPLAAVTIRTVRQSSGGNTAAFPPSRDRQCGFVSAHNWAQHTQSIQQYSCVWCPNTPHTVGLLYIIQTTRYRGLTERSAPGVGDAAQEQAEMPSSSAGGGAGTCLAKQPQMLGGIKKS